MVAFFDHLGLTATLIDLTLMIIHIYYERSNTSDRMRS